MRNFWSFAIFGIFCVAITLLISYGLWGSAAKEAYTRNSALTLTAAAQKGKDAVVFVYKLTSDTSVYYGQNETGSGVIISDDGYVVTNHHVIAGGYTIHVQLNDNHEYHVEVVGIDSSHDVALLKIKAIGFSFLEFGNSDSLLVGEQVLAVGNPHRLHSTVTSGIVSAKDRLLDLPNNTTRNFIQTDVPINYGNSGGPLLNARGQLIGLNIAFFSNSGAYEGFSFAIPSNLVKKIVEDIKQFGSNQRGAVDMTIRPVTQEIAAESGMSEIFGVVVDAVGADGNADKAGLQSLDILLSLDGQKITSNADLLDRLALHRPGDILLFEVLRERKVSNIKVTMDRRKE
jgi:serine protease Do